MKFILGTKEGMTQVFDADGTCHGATVLRVTPATITQVKTAEADGYDAVQVATREQKEQRVNKAQKAQPFKHVKEFRTRVNYDDSVAGLQMGQTVDASTFEAGDQIVVSAVSKGKGFQGVVKRYNFKGNKATHGQKHTLRAPGSIGATGPARVFKGTRMAGRMGTDRKTVKNLRVLQVNADDNLILVSGAVPGRKGTLVEVRNV
tara:strand:+ start:586 stop:1197 length:612 start_codon:yes stop_codon:yes gene_type:complete